MMKIKILYFFSFVLLSYIKSTAQVNFEIEAVKLKFAPDKRTAIYEVFYNKKYNSLVGKTNLVQAKHSLLKKTKNYNVIDSIVLLPDFNVGTRVWAVVNVSVGNLRAYPEEYAELTSQTLMGTRLKILEKRKSWYRVQAPDDYIGWINGSSITRIEDKQYKELIELPKLVYLSPYGFAKSDTTDFSDPVCDLTFGNIFIPKDTNRNFIKIELPDKRIAFIKKSEALSTELWLKSIETKTFENLKKSALGFTGIPYLWGGTSFKGVDCSGFVKMAYFSQGLFLPRDASQQAKLGNVVPHENNFKDLIEGDLLYFGNAETKKVVHVAIWIGNKSFIHASGMVKVNSFDKSSPFYDEYNFNRLLFVKRLNKSLISFNQKNLYKF